MNAHTPGDWYFYLTRSNEWRIAVKDGNSSPIQVATAHTADEHGRISGDDAYANAETIVRAVNSHDALVAALKLSRTNVSGMLHRLPVNADRTERRALETWLGEINGALAAANVF